jgi:hypothetical protein
MMKLTDIPRIPGLLSAIFRLIEAHRNEIRQPRSQPIVRVARLGGPELGFCLHPATNNLVVVAGVCFARNAILQIKISEACPVYMLIAPETGVTFGFLEDNTVPF